MHTWSSCNPEIDSGRLDSLLPSSASIRRCFKFPICITQALTLVTSQKSMSSAETTYTQQLSCHFTCKFHCRITHHLVMQLRQTSAGREWSILPVIQRPSSCCKSPMLAGSSCSLLPAKPSLRNCTVPHFHQLTTGRKVGISWRCSKKSVIMGQNRGKWPCKGAERKLFRQLQGSIFNCIIIRVYS